MTAQQIIEEIKRLDPKEQLGVIRFAYQLDAERQRSGQELSKLAARITETDDVVEAATIRETIVRGFYGAKEQCLKSGGIIFRRLCLTICSTEFVRGKFLPSNFLIDIRASPRFIQANPT